MATTIEIINNGASLKIRRNDVPRDIIKSQIHEVTVLRDTIIKIDIGQGALFNVFIDQAFVTTPHSTDVNDLREQILLMLAPATSGGSSQTLTGFSTETNQVIEISHISNLQSQVQDLQTKVGSINDKVFFQPSIVDQNNPNMVYKGYAPAGTRTDAGLWAIERVQNQDGIIVSAWSNGNKGFTNIWDNRDKVEYL